MRVVPTAVEDYSTSIYAYMKGELTGERAREREGSVLGDVHRRLQDHLQLKDAVLLRRPLVEEGSRPPSKAFDIGYWEQHA